MDVVTDTSIVLAVVFDEHYSADVRE